MENKGKERQLHKTAVQISDMYESSAMFDRLSEFVDDTKVEKPLYKISAYTSDCFGFSVLCTLSPKMGKLAFGRHLIIVIRPKHGSMVVW